MEKRTCRRMKVNLKTEFYCRNMLYTGNIENISEKGMFISMEEICFPADSRFEVLINHDNNVFGVPAYVRRVIMNPDSFHGIGLEITDPPEKYLEFVSSLSNAG